METRKEISKELKKLDSQDIIEIARAIDIKEDSLSLDYVIHNRGQAISKLLDIAERRNILCQLKKEITEIQEPSPYESGEKNSPSKYPSKKPFEQELAELLLSLNYTDQYRQFETVMTNNKGGAFIIQEDEQIIQNWLVCRLANQYTAKIFKIDLRFYHEITTNFETGFSKAFYNTDINCQQLIDKLINLLCLENKSVVVVISGLKYLGNQLNKIYDFFSRLLERFKDTVDGRSVISSIVFLLIDDKVKKTEDNNITHLESLKQIPNNEIALWLNKKYVSQCLQENGINLSSIYNKYSNCLTTQNDEMPPLLKLNKICTDIFEIQNGTEQLEQYWKLDRIGT